MSRILIASLAALFLGGVSLAQVPENPAAQQPSTQQQQTPTPAPPNAQTNSAPASRPSSEAAPRVSPGSVIPVQLAKTVDAKKIKSGAEVVAKVTEDLKTTNGEVVFPKDTKVIGHVTEAQARSKEQKESDLGIAFDHAVLKDGSEVKMPLSIQAIIAPPNANPSNGSSGGYQQSAGAPSGGGTSQAGTNSRGVGGNTTNTAPPPSAAPPSSDAPADAQASNGARPAITTKTQGVVGISDLKLTTAAPNAEQGSVVSSEKNNVKLEGGTLMLLRVN